MIDPAWIPVVAAASGAVIAFIGGLIGAGISYLNTRQQLKHQAAREDRKLKIDQLDELSRTVEEVRLIAFDMFGKSGVVWTTEGGVKMSSGLASRIARVRVLTMIHAPHLHEQYIAMDKAGKKLLLRHVKENVAKKITTAEQEDGELSQWALVTAIDGACENYQNEIALVIAKRLELMH